MLTPVFSLSQDDKNVIVEIRTPYIRLDKTEIFYEGREFIFTSLPYFLRLFLPGSVVSSDSQSDTAKYDAETSTFKILVEKENFGEKFAGLDMITHLLTPNGRKHAADLVEMYEANPITQSDSATIVEDSVVEEFGYGFGSMKSGVLAKLRDEIKLLLTTVDPDFIPTVERLQLCFEAEQEKFDEDYYLVDMYDSDIIDRLMYFKPDWTATQFTLEEKERLKELPKRLYHLSDGSTTSAFYSLVDILFAFAYDYRTTEGEMNVESGWTIATLSSTLTGFVQFDSIKHVIVSAVRRSLSYPLYRRWDLSMKVLQDVKQIIKLGSMSVIKCLLEIHRIFAIAGDYRYILNDLYITDYCVWLQSVKESQFESLLIQLSDVQLTKVDVMLNLEELEMSAAMDSLKLNNRGEGETGQLKSDLDVLNYVRSFTESTAEPKKLSGDQIDSDDDSNESDD